MSSRSVFRRVLLVGLVVAIVGVLGVALAWLTLPWIAGTGSVRESARIRLESYLSAVLGAEVSIAEISGLGLGGVEARGVSVAKGGHRLITAPSVSAVLRIGRAWYSAVAIDLELRDASIEVSRDSRGRWDLVDLFASGEAPEQSATGPAGSPGMLRRIGIRIENSRLTIAGVGSSPVVMAPLDAQLGIDLPSASSRSGWLSIERLVARLEQGSEMSGDGWVELGGAGQLAFGVELAKLRAADILLPPSVGLLLDDARGWLQLWGNVDAPQGQGRVDWVGGGSDLWAKLDSEQLIFSYQLAGFDPRRLAPSAPAATLAGAGSVVVPLGEGDGPGLRADARLWQSQIAGVAVDWLTLQAREEGEAIVLDAQGALPGSVLSWNLQSTVGQAAPHAIQGEVGFEVADGLFALAPWAAGLEGTALRGTLKLHADRVDLLDAAGGADLELCCGRIRDIPIDRVKLDVAFASRELQVRTLEVTGAGTDLHGGGSATVIDGGAPRLEAAALRGELDLGLLPGFAGAVKGEVTATRKGDGMEVVADFATDRASWARQMSYHGKVRASVSGLEEQRGWSFSTGTLEAEGDWSAGESLQGWLGSVARNVRVAARLAPEPGRGDRLDLSVAATERDGRRHVLEASARGAMARLAGQPSRATSPIEVEVAQFRVAPKKGPVWSLARAGRVTWDERGALVRDLSLRAGAGEVGLSGAIPATVGQSTDLRLTSHGIDLGLICQLAGVEASCSGEVAADLQLAGSTDRPGLRGAFGVSRVRIEGVEYGALSAQLASDPGLAVDATLDSPGGGQVQLRARLAGNEGGSAPDRPSSWDSAPISGEIHARAFVIDGLRPLLGASALDQLSGRATLDLELGGTVATPRLRGGGRVDDLVAGIAATRAAYHGGTLEFLLDGDRLEIVRLLAEEGRVTGGGVIGLGNLGSPALSLWLHWVDALLVDRPDSFARGGGDIRVDGTVSAPRIAGAVFIDRGLVKPSLLPVSSVAPRDPTIVVVGAAGQVGGRAEPAGVDPKATFGAVLADVSTEAPSTADALAMRIDVKLGDDVRVQRFDGEIQLGGDVYLTKAPRDPVRVSGEIASRHGWYVFEGRRIEVQEAYVTFSGELPLNPYLFVVGRHRTAAHLVTLTVQGTMLHPELALTSDPPLEQADILALLLFGRTSGELRGGQGAALQQQALALLASYAAPELRQSVMDTLGLSTLTFAPPTGDSPGTVGIGRYLGDDLFISIARDFGGPQGGTPRQLRGLVGSSIIVQYYLTPSITVQSAASTEGESSIDVYWQRRY